MPCLNFNSWHPYFGVLSIYYTISEDTSSLMNNVFFTFYSKGLLKASSFQKNSVYPRICSHKDFRSQTWQCSCHCFPQIKCFGDKKPCMMSNLNLSWPAVSQICSLTDLPPTFTTLLPNSTPIVWFESCLTATHSNYSKVRL